MNVKKTLKNSILSIISQILISVLQFANRRIFILFLDIEYLGYQTVFSNVFSLLSVAELGIGNIISFHLYKELAEDNREEIGKLMYLYKWMYRAVAGVVLLAGCICYFFLPAFVKNPSAGWPYLRLIYVLQLSGVTAGYFLSYKRTVYIASQQEYRCIEADMAVSAVFQVMQLVALALSRSYILYLCLQLCIPAVSNVVIARKAGLDYPYLKKRYCISMDDIKRRNIFADARNFLAHRLAYAVYGGTDNIILSAACGARMVALFGNYAVLQAAVQRILFYRMLNPLQAAIGNIVHGNTAKEKQWEQFQVLDVFSFFFASYTAAGFYIFLQPVVALWMGEKYLLSDSFVLVYTVLIYFGAVWEIVYKYRTVFGDYRQDRNCMILAALLNIAISVPGALYLGVTGVTAGSLAAFFPIAYGRIRFVVGSYFHKPVWKYMGRHLMLALAAFGECLLCRLICDRLPVTMIGLAGRAVIWAAVPAGINVWMYYKNENFKKMLAYLRQMVSLVLRRKKSGEKEKI